MKRSLYCLAYIFIFLCFPGLCTAEENDNEMPLDLQVTIKDYRTDLTRSLAEELETQTKIVMGSMANMFNIKVWVYEIEGDIETVFENQVWPAETTLVPVSKNRLGNSIDMLVSRNGEELEEVWGKDWTKKAKAAAEKYKDREALTRIIIMPPDENITTYTLTIVTPYTSMKSFDITEGLFLIITEMSL